MYSERERAVSVGVEVWRAAQLGDPRGQPVGVVLLLGGMQQELLRNRLGVEALGRVVVLLVAQDADQLGGQCCVEHRDDPIEVGAVGGGNRALLDLLAGPLAQVLARR